MRKFDVYYGVCYTLTVSIFILVHLIPTDTYAEVNNNSNNSSIQFSVYRNISNGFEIQYPANWIKDDTLKPVLSKIANPLVSFSCNCSANAYFNVVRQKITSTPSLLELANGGIKRVKELASNFNLTQEPIIFTINGMNAVEYSFTDNTNQREYQTLQVAVVKDNNLYVMLASAEDIYFDHQLPTFQKMISSFRIISEASDVAELVSRGKELDGLGMHSEALELFDKALDIDPNAINALIGKGLALDGLGRFEEATQAYDKVLSIDPNNVLAHGLRGIEILQLSNKENDTRK